MKCEFRNVFILFAILFSAFMIHAFKKFVLDGEGISNKVYADNATVDFMANLIAKKWIVCGDKGPCLSKSAVAQMNPSEIALATQLLPGVEKSFLGLRFDDRFVSIVHPKCSRNLRGRLRGRIFDRNGELLVGWESKSRERRSVLGPAAFHLLGYGGELYRKTGVEAACDAVLNGGMSPWWRLFWRGDNPLGGDISVSVDSGVQRVAYNAMVNRTGAVVVLAPASGDILALVSTPSFDPNTPPGLEWNRAEESPDHPFANRALTERYPPGSIFKLVVAGAGLSAGTPPVMNLSKFDKRLSISDHRAFGRMGFREALAVSSNVYFSRWGVRVGPGLVEICKKFGMTAPLPIITGPGAEGISAIPSLGFQWSRSAKGGFPFFSEEDFRRNSKLVAQGAIGQNIVQATPVQMAAIVSAIANRGTLMKLRLVIESAGKSVPPEVFSEPIKPQVAGQIIQAMREVFEKGTAQHLKKIYWSGNGYSLAPGKGAKRISVACKTGTAEVQGRKSHSWFVCFAPDVPDSPVVCVLVEHAGYGAESAGPVGITVLKDALNAVAGENRQ